MITTFGRLPATADAADAADATPLKSKTHAMAYFKIGGIEQ
jgi:hypothetical protein